MKQLIKKYDVGGSFTGSGAETTPRLGSFKDAVAQFKQLFSLKTPDGLANIGKAADTISSLLPLKKEYSGAKGAFTSGVDSAYDKISDSVAAIPGFGMAASAIMKANKLLGSGLNAIGGGTDGMTTGDAILGSSFLAPIGAINGFAGKRAHDMLRDDEAFETVGGSYGGTAYNVSDAMSKANKKYGLISSSARKKANALIDEATRLQGIMSKIADKSRLQSQAMGYMADVSGRARQFLLSGGYDQASVHAGKHGMSIDKLQFAKRVQSLLKVNKFQKGSVMNVIPEGALHAHKHHIDDSNSELKGLITTKGIPVITKEEGGEIVQHAEVERNEIIFTKSVTNLIEKFRKEGTDEAAIKAGKLLTKEILENTDDRTGLIQQTE